MQRETRQVGGHKSETVPKGAAWPLGPDGHQGLADTSQASQDLGQELQGLDLSGSEIHLAPSDCHVLL